MDSLNQTKISNIISITSFVLVLLIFMQNWNNNSTNRNSQFQNQNQPESPLSQFVQKVDHYGSCLKSCASAVNNDNNIVACNRACRDVEEQYTKAQQSESSTNEPQIIYQQVETQSSFYQNLTLLLAISTAIFGYWFWDQHLAQLETAQRELIQLTVRVDNLSQLGQRLKEQIDAQEKSVKETTEKQVITNQLNTKLIKELREEIRKTNSRIVNAVERHMEATANKTPPVTESPGFIKRIFN